MMNKYGAFIIPFVIICCLLITGLLFYQNVNARKHEIGLLKAIGTSSSTIIFMILFKAFILGLAGSIAGFFLGKLGCRILWKRDLQIYCIKYKTSVVDLLLYYCNIPGFMDDQQLDTGIDCYQN